MSKRLIAVVGGTGAQGGGVVDALLKHGGFAVRVASRNPDSESGRALAARGVEVVKADLLDPDSLAPFFAGAHGAFIVTNFWDPTQMQRETEVGTAAVKAAREAGVSHLIWSTLPNSAAISGGSLAVTHFTSKALVDEVVAAAGFPRYTFVGAPMYFQNFLTMMGPQPLPTGGKGWAVPMDPAARVIHAGDVSEVGLAVAAAFASTPEDLPNGTFLGVCGGTYSWNDFVETLNGQGHELSVIQVPAEVYDSFYPGAHEMREMFQYFERFTYYGPDHVARVENARRLVPGGFTSFETWAGTHMPAAGAAS